ncbi:cathepsin CPC1 [Besnoitia besnoiti]|uniref:Cathepsin CPC1 n=1 Tax=Besnoitia besnoiti TaxID=94643 RepID=A0A2A9M9P1_BESBE|nr:cathepsin CPC1 [Besnoitia besnoiti]PFH32100.1 cathepsin CPC1 [Besnoitia besnoiti]
MEGARWFRRRCATLLVAGSLVCLGWQAARADLPIHSTVSDIKGDWTFFLSPPVTGAVNSCGSPAPNRNLANLRDELKDYKLFLENYGGIQTQLHLSLDDTPVSFAAVRAATTTDNAHRAGWKTLGVFDSKDKKKLVGGWSTVYDEGFEAHVGDDLRLMGFLKYYPKDNCSPHDGDLENSQGDTSCYATDSSRTHIGWYIRHPTQGDVSSGCFYAEKTNTKDADPVSFVFVETTSRAGRNSSSARDKMSSNAASYISREFVDKHNASAASSWRAGVNSVFENMGQHDLLRFVKNFGFKKMRRRGGVDANPSFMQSSSGASSAEMDTAATQVYACPCKNGEKPLDTRDRNESDDTLAVLSPVSALETGSSSFLAAVNRHESLSERGIGAEMDAHAQSPSQGSDILPVWEPERAIHQTDGKGHLILPKAFSWSNPFSGSAFDEHVINQGGCGSCYAVAATYALQKRFEIAASRMLGRKVRLFGSTSESETAGSGKSISFLNIGSTTQLGELSPQSVLSCSFYNQGCDGGFPYLVGKHARDIGIPQSGCMKYHANDMEACPFQRTAALGHAEKPSMLQDSATAEACAEHSRWYAKDYGYVGGCYECNQCSGERQIMEEIYKNGPVPVAFDAPPSLFAYSSGIFDTVSDHARVCDTDAPQCKGVLTGWEYTNHAVTLVGWGETKATDTEGAKKYWIVRNTWGPSWGNQGHLMIARGKNLGGIESQATFIDPDFTRGQGLKVAEAIANLKRNNPAE